jgi:hypothetical protein
MQFDTLRLRLVKLAARVVELKTQVKIHLPTSAPDQAIFAMLLVQVVRHSAGFSSQLTQRWRKTDSNSWSHFQRDSGSELAIRFPGRRHRLKVTSLAKARASC